MAQPLRLTIDQGVNLKKLKNLQNQGKVILYQVHDLEQLFKGVLRQGKAFTIGQSRIGGPDMIAADNVPDVQQLVGLNNRNDFQHIYSAYLNRSDYFITEDIAAFIEGNKKDLLEKTLGLKIRRTDEFLVELTQQ